MERITSAQPPPYAPKQPPVDLADMHRLDFPIYVCKQRRSMKRVDDKETYKLPHRLIEKKRRDRINECIAQLKDLLPEHLKLTTLGHLEKAVVLELTLKHVKTISAVLEQQQQKILALQKDLQNGDHAGDGAESGEMFRSGFHLCAREVVHFLATQDSSREVAPAHLISHIQKVAAEVLHLPDPEEPPRPAPEKALVPPPAPHQVKNCVPVIQRTFYHGTGEQSGSDTDTDSGYGGEPDKTKAQWAEDHGAALKAAGPERPDAVVKREEGGEPRAKRSRPDSVEEDVAVVTGGYRNFSTQSPFCLPFYMLPPTAAAAYLPMLEKCWYPGGVPLMYPGLGGSLAMSPPPQLARADSPAPYKAPKQVSPLDLETKD